MHKKTFKRISMILLMAFAFVFGCTKVLAEHTYGTGDVCFTFDIDSNGFPMTEVTVNGYPWEHDTQDPYVYHNSEVVFEIHVLAGKKENDFPEISTPGGFSDYGHVDSAKNPNDDPNLVGDEYLFTINVDENMTIGGNGCYGLGLSIHEGPEPGGSEQTGAFGEVTIHINGSDIEYHYVEDKPDEPDAVRLKFAINSNNIEEDQIPFTFGNATFKGGVMPPNATGVSTTNPIDYHYNYDDSGTVDFFIMGASNIEYTKFIINGYDFVDQVPHLKDEIYEHHIGRALQFWITNVPYNVHGYDIVVDGQKMPNENLVGSFGWNYKKESEPDYDPNEDSLFTHGTLQFVQVKYTDLDNVTYTFDDVTDYNNARFHGTGEIYEWHDGKKDYDDRREAWGEALVPYGAELTIKVVPDPGYQLVSLTNSNAGFTALDEPGVYKIIFNEENMSNGADNFHLGARFEAVGDTVTTTATNVLAGTIDVNEDFANGTAKLEVKDVVSMSPERVESFEQTATNEGYEIDSYVDMSLYNTIYKGGKKDDNNNYEGWDTEVTDLTNNATVTLELQQDLSGKDLAIIHEVHDGDTILGYDVIPVQYDSQNNSITFETDGFSYYALMTKNSSTQPDMVTVEFNTQGGTQISSVEIDKGTPVERPSDPENGDKVFGGWFEEEECEHEWDFATPVNDDLILYARWDEPSGGTGETIPYSVEEEGGSLIEFKDESGHSFHLHIQDFLKMTDQELEAAGIPLDLFNQVKEILTESTKQYGTMLSVLEIYLEDENHNEIHQPLEGNFTLKIRMTDEMKQYNTFKLIYLNDDFSLGQVITLEKQTIGGVDYLVGTLNHLSNYVLTGTTTNNSTNPQTFDNIYTYVFMLIASILTMAWGFKLVKKM